MTNTAPRFYYNVISEPPSATCLIPCYISVAAEGCPLPDAYLNGRPVYFGDIDYRGVDSFMHGCTYADTDEELSDNEHDELMDQCADYLCEQVQEHYGYYPK